MFFFPRFPTAAEREAECRAIDQRIASSTQPWKPDIKWQTQLAISAESFNTWLKEYYLFGGSTARHEELRAALPREKLGHVRGKLVAVSPTARFAYTMHELPRGEDLRTYSGSRQGDVLFDGPVSFPTLLDLTWYDRSENVWMSLTPMEILSLRPGTKKATKHTVIAGLGLGYQLIQVSRKRSVKQITLVEKEQEIVDWLMPEISKLLGPVPVTTIVGDARKVLPTLEADVALIDIARGYGGGAFYERCPGIRELWVWGAANIKGDGYW